MAIHEPLVSIGIPTYNRPGGLRRMLECIVNQTYTNLEIIVSDNCSPDDETERIVQAFIQKDSRIHYFRQKQNVGIFYNYKFVIDQAQGEYFAWACDDDFRDARFIEICLQKFNSSDKLILIGSYSTRLDPQSGNILAVDRGCTTIGIPAYRRFIRYRTTIYTEQAAVGDIFYGVGKRRFLANAMHNQAVILGWDHTLLAQLALDGEFYTVPEELMSSSALGASSDSTRIARNHLIEGSLSERMPVWVREIQYQKIIRNSPNLSGIEKIGLSIWSFSYYLLSRGFKLWIKGVFPNLYAWIKNCVSSKPNNVRFL